MIDFEIPADVQAVRARVRKFVLVKHKRYAHAAVQAHTPHLSQPHHPRYHAAPDLGRRSDSQVHQSRRLPRVRLC